MTGESFRGQRRRHKLVDGGRIAEAVDQQDGVRAFAERELPTPQAHPFRVALDSGLPTAIEVSYDERISEIAAEP